MTTYTGTERRDQSERGKALRAIIGRFLGPRKVKNRLTISMLALNAYRIGYLQGQRDAFASTNEELAKLTESNP